MSSEVTVVHRQLESQCQRVAHPIYECPRCQERMVGERRCSRCQLYCNALGLTCSVPCLLVFGVTEREVYAGRILTLRLKYLRQADGSARLREIVEHAPGAAVVAVDTDGRVLLVRQFRPAVEASLLELPAGLVDPGEQPSDCARRELAEETGYTADRLQPLVRFYTSPGFTDELIHIFVATELRESVVEPDAEEEIELVRMPLERAIDQVLEGEISDAKTVAGLLAYQRLAIGRTANG